MYWCEGNLVALKRLAATHLLLFWAITFSAFAAPVGAQQASLTPPDIRAVSLNDANLAFGRQQVDQILRDRPEMTVYVHSGDPVYNWAIRQLAGGAVGSPISWAGDFGNYPAEFNAYHAPPYGTVKGYITLRRQFVAGPLANKLVPGNILWSSFVFELFNISNTRQLLANYRAALDGKVTRQEFIAAGARNEFKAVAKMAAFYHQFWLPLIKKRHLRSDASAWFVDTPATYEQWISQFTDPSHYPYSYWGKYYDEKIAPYRAAMEAYRKQQGQSPTSAPF